MSYSVIDSTSYSDHKVCLVLFEGTVREMRVPSDWTDSQVCESAELYDAQKAAHKKMVEDYEKDIKEHTE